MGYWRSWNRIAAALGVSRQAARQRFGGKVGANPGYESLRARRTSAAARWPDWTAPSM